MNHKMINKCRSCGGESLLEILNLGEQAMTGYFPSVATEEVYSGPLQLLLCEDRNCQLLQLSADYSLDEMYGDNYGYRSGLNESMMKHLNGKIDKIKNKYVKLSSGDVVLDIGSNDGTTLRNYSELKLTKIGIDPTAAKFINYYDNDVIVVPDFFTAELFFEASSRRKASIVTSFSMYYDLPNPLKFAKDIYNILNDDGVWVFEQSYLPAMLQTGSFDTICHEHLEYYSFTSIYSILNRANLKVVDVEFNDINGGSFSIVAAKNDSYLPQYNEIERIIAYEKSLNLFEPKGYISFIDKINLEKKLTLDFLNGCKENNLSVLGLGASTKGNVLLQYYRINDNILPIIGEVNEYKFGRYTPGTKIAICDEKDLLNNQADFIFAIPWHFRDTFKAISDKYKIPVVFPLPYFHIYFPKT